jgi:hypothetical protein
MLERAALRTRHRALDGEDHVGLQRAVIRHTLGLVPSVEDMTNWGGDYLNGQAVVGASCADNSTINDLERLFFRVRSQATGQRG